MNQFFTVRQAAHNGLPNLLAVQVARIDDSETYGNTFVEALR
jgi:hypothetical protein